MIPINLKNASKILIKSCTTPTSRPYQGLPVSIPVPRIGSSGADILGYQQIPPYSGEDRQEDEC